MSNPPHYPTSNQSTHREFGQIPGPTDRKPTSFGDTCPDLLGAQRYQRSQQNSGHEGNFVDFVDSVAREETSRDGTINTLPSGPALEPLVVAPRVDWAAERGRLDLVAVISREIGSPTTKGNRHWWQCPFHDDGTPSFVARTFSDGGQGWRCYGCGAKGDAAAFVMRMHNLTFQEAVGYLTGGAVPLGRPASAKAVVKRKPSKPTQPSGWHGWALGLVESAERRLWSAEGTEAREYLYGRGLTDDTIRSARLGLIVDRLEGAPAGVTIPWFHGDRLTMVNVRRPAGSKPKYMVFTGSRRGGIYPGPAVVKPSLPLVVVEGEFDALLLGQELSGLAAVVTLGSAGDQADRSVLAAFLSAPRWYAAHDTDEAGETSASPWLGYDRCRRVRPPGAFKDWTEAAAGGVNLRRWWGEILSGVEQPPLFTWTELSAWRWGPGLGDPTPGIDIGRRSTARGGTP